MIEGESFYTTRLVGKKVICHRGQLEVPVSFSEPEGELGSGEASKLRKNLSRLALAGLSLPLASDLAAEVIADSHDPDLQVEKDTARAGQQVIIAEAPDLKDVPQLVEYPEPTPIPPSISSKDAEEYYGFDKLEELGLPVDSTEQAGIDGVFAGWSEGMEQAIKRLDSQPRQNESGGLDPEEGRQEKPPGDLSILNQEPAEPEATPTPDIPVLATAPAPLPETGAALTPDQIETIGTARLLTPVFIRREANFEPDSKIVGLPQDTQLEIVGQQGDFWVVRDGDSLVYITKSGRYVEASFSNPENPIPNILLINHNQEEQTQPPETTVNEAAPEQPVEEQKDFTQITPEQIHYYDELGWNTPAHGPGFTKHEISNVPPQYSEFFNKENLTALLQSAINLDPEAAEIWQTIIEKCGEIHVGYEDYNYATFGYFDKYTQPTAYITFNPNIYQRHSGDGFRNEIVTIGELYAIAYMIRTGVDSNTLHGDKIERIKWEWVIGFIDRLMSERPNDIPLLSPVKEQYLKHLS